MSGRRADARFAAVAAAVAARRADIDRVTAAVHARPELAHEETEAVAALAAALQHGLTVRIGIDGMSTAFRATLEGAHPGCTVGLVAVYDAVAVATEDGDVAAVHSCGHGPIAGAVVGAALALADLGDLHGSVVVVGAPADELVSPSAIRRGGGKTLGLQGELWRGIDHVVYVHPESHTGVWRASRWLRLIEVVSDADPRGWELPAGQVAVGDVESLADGWRAVLRVFGGSADELDEREELAHALSGAHGWTVLGTAEGLRADGRVAAAAEDALAGLGITADPVIPPMPFSTDFGNVSRRIPSAMVGLARDGDGWDVHGPDGAEQFASPEGAALARRAAAVLAVTADILTRRETS
ncbi:M20/M25/M40 family metallo-hydrolase [Microbacterium sp. 18062]|uniref:M20/M25/M40 family metallo-hydrolase n=1 Tax=Microbacterium sp. 18062 TaxID=2681410 RepID=UPI001359DDDE|nr:M20/M25/M40 family metallo-hydrolase [Microbacterium sp. 18062]